MIKEIVMQATAAIVLLSLSISVFAAPTEYQALPQNDPKGETMFLNEDTDASISKLSEICTKNTDAAWDASRVTMKDMGIKDTYVPKEYVEHAKSIIRNYFPKLPLSLVLAVIESESSGRKDAYNPKYGCKGLMQINENAVKKILKELGITDLFDPYQNILVGCTILWTHIEKYKDIPTALMKYNGSSDAVKRGKTKEYTRYATKILKRCTELYPVYN